MAIPPCLPEDIITDILSRLPVKTLTRFKSLSKHYLSLFTDPSFITTHLQHSTLNPSILIVRDNIKSNVTDFGISLLSREIKPVLQDVHIPSMDDHLSRFQILGSCNGLLCLKYSRCCCCFTKLVLWNPATREFRQVPESELIERPPGTYLSGAHYGFGFNGDINDYMLVRILSFHDREEVEEDLRVLKAVVFTWSTGSWRGIDDGLLQNGCYGKSVTVKGFLYWKVNGIGELANKEFIVSFDMVNEVFSRIPFPGSDNKILEVCRDITVFKGSLAVFVYPFLYPECESSNNTSELWTMSEYNGGGGGEIWSKLYTFGPFLSFSSPAGLWKDCQVIMQIEDFDENNRGLFLCDPSDQEITHVPTHGTEYLYETYNYVESLVSVIGGNNVVEDAHMSDSE